MTTSETRKFEMLVRVDGFRKLHIDLFPPASLGGQNLQVVHDSVEQLRAHSVSKRTSAKGGRKAKSLAREALIGQLETVSRSARGIAVTHAGFDDPFQVPLSRRDEALVTAARTFIQEAERVKEQFTLYDMSDDFIAQLTKCVDDFERAAREQQTRRDQQEAAPEAAPLTALEKAS